MSTHLAVLIIFALALFVLAVTRKPKPRIYKRTVNIYIKTEPFYIPASKAYDFHLWLNQNCFFDDIYTIAEMQDLWESFLQYQKLNPKQ